MLKFGSLCADTYSMSWDLHSTPRPFLARELCALIALSQACDDWMPTRQQLNEMERWAATGYDCINKRLRGVDDYFQGWWSDKELTGLDERIALLASTTPVASPELTLWRGVRIPTGEGPVAGQAWTDDGFMSASILRRRAEKAVHGYRDFDRQGISYDKWLLKIDVAEGHPIIPVYWAMLNDPDGENARQSSKDPRPYSVNEAEILLTPGTQIICSSIKQRADGVNVATVRLLAARAVSADARAA